MLESRLQKKKVCWKCGATPVELHHIFNKYNKKNSEKYGLYVYLCPEHHRGTNGVHGMSDKVTWEELKELAQEEFERDHTRNEFIEIFGRNYL